jgi:non-heme chloroperoxidase
LVTLSCRCGDCFRLPEKAALQQIEIMKKLFFFFPVLVLNLLLMAQTLEGVDSSHFVIWPTITPAVANQTLPKPEIKTITLTNGLALEYAEQGDEAGTPVIFLHGYSDSWRSWETVMPHLPSSLHVFALSQRGHGNSSKPATSYHPQDFAADVAAFMKLKGLKEAVIAGHSMGATITQCFAVNYPVMAKAVVLVASLAAYDKPVITEFKKMIDDLKDPVDSAFVTEFQKSTILRPTPGMSLDTIVAESRKLPVHVWKGVAVGWKVSDFRKALPAYTKPALIVWGDKDSYCSLEDQETLRKALKKSTLKIYEDVGHALHWEVPERFAGDLVQFVQSLPSETGLAKQ